MRQNLFWDRIVYCAFEKTISWPHSVYRFLPGGLNAKDGDSHQSIESPYPCKPRRSRGAIRGPKGQLEGVRILGPERKETQCEILASDVFKLGVQGCPVCESGQLEGSFPFEVIGPAGSIKKERGLIIAKRHIHFDLEAAKHFGVSDKQIVKLKAGEERGAILLNVVCRVHPTYALECHIDFDEGNALGITSGAIGEIVYC